MRNKGVGIVLGYILHMQGIGRSVVIRQKSEFIKLA